MARFPLRRRRRRPSITRLLRQLPNLFRLVVDLIRDPRVPGFDRALFAAIVAYVISPFDLIPDWMGVFGLTDDFYLVGLGLKRLVNSAGPDILLEYWRGSPKTLGYIVESIERVGSALPRRIRSALRGTVFGR